LLSKALLSKNWTLGKIDQNESREPNRVARFFSVQHTKKRKKYTERPKMYQMAIKYISFGRKVEKMATKIPHLPLQDLLKFTRIGIFSLKIYHLATLESNDELALKPHNSSNYLWKNSCTLDVFI
jgi:hypothetical protein